MHKEPLISVFLAFTSAILYMLFKSAASIGHVSDSLGGPGGKFAHRAVGRQKVAAFCSSGRQFAALREALPCTVQWSVVFVASGVVCGAMANVNEICVETGNVCEAFLTTSGNTCTQACADAGLMCEAGLDDQDACIPKDNDSGRCDVARHTQICRCVTGDPH